MPPCLSNHLGKEISIGEVYKTFKELDLSDIVFVYNLNQGKFKSKINLLSAEKVDFIVNKDCKMSSSKGSGDVCGICDELVTETDKAICCDICEIWHHAKCITMNDASYKMFKRENLPWVCPECISGKRDEKGLHELILSMLNNAKEEKEERAMMMMMLKKLSEQMISLEKTIEDKINEKIKISEKRTMEKINENVEKMNENVDEKLEAFRRRKNIIVYGMPEEKNEDHKSRCEIDDTNIKNLLKELKTNVKRYEIARIGKQIVDGRPRPIRIELDRESDKYEILKGAFNLKTTRNEIFKRVIITTDMS